MVSARVRASGAYPDPGCDLPERPGCGQRNSAKGDRGTQWSAVYKQPLDLVLCPTLHWGCRYLTVDHRTLVGHVWKPEAIADLRAGKSEPQGITDALFGKKAGVKDFTGGDRRRLPTASCVAFRQI